MADIAFPWELQKLERCAGRTETHFPLRWRKAAFCNLLLDPHYARAKTEAEKSHVPTCSFSPETLDGSVFTVLHLGTIWILTQSLSARTPCEQHIRNSTAFPSPHCCSISKSIGNVHSLRGSPGVFVLESMKCAQHVQKLLLTLLSGAGLQLLVGNSWAQHLPALGGSSMHLLPWSEALWARLMDLVQLRTFESAWRIKNEIPKWCFSKFHSICCILLMYSWGYFQACLFCLEVRRICQNVI